MTDCERNRFLPSHLDLPAENFRSCIFPATSLVQCTLRWVFFVCLLKQMKLLGECSGSIDLVKRLGYKLKEEEEKLSGLTNLNSTETQTAGKSYSVF